MIVKPLSKETTLESATNVSSASVVRLVNTGAGNALVTIADEAGSHEDPVASLTLVAGEVVNIQKAPSHTLLATASVKAVKVAHTN